MMSIQDILSEADPEGPPSSEGKILSCCPGKYAGDLRLSRGVLCGRYSTDLPDPQGRAALQMVNQMDGLGRNIKVKQEFKSRGQKHEEALISGKLVWRLFHKFGQSLVASS